MFPTDGENSSINLTQRRAPFSSRALSIEAHMSKQTDLCLSPSQVAFTPDLNSLLLLLKMGTCLLGLLLRLNEAVDARCLVRGMEQVRFKEKHPCLMLPSEPNLWQRGSGNWVLCPADLGSHPPTLPLWANAVISLCVDFFIRDRREQQHLIYWFL